MKENVIPQQVLESYSLASAEVVPFGNGLINHTWLVTAGDEKLILQRINDKIFRQPQDIADNIHFLSAYLQQHEPQYFFPAPVRNHEGGELTFAAGNGWYRLWPFVKNSCTLNVVQTPQQAYEAAAQFGKFTSVLSGFDASRLKITIADFHNLPLRYSQLEAAMAAADDGRKKKALQAIQDIISHKDLVIKFQKISSDSAFKLRVTHHDTKISNVLFDKYDRGICVIDLDTVMPGLFISDVGDMIRTYLSPVDEEEQNFSAIKVRDEFYLAVVEGYYHEMKDVLTAAEKKSFFFAGCFLIYMQALRFLTDYLNNDVYYGARYADHNLQRARNQLVLLQRLTEKKERLETTTGKIMKA